MGLSTTKLANVQVLRALAALWVITVHLGATMQTVGLDPRYGGCGVDLFFAISGYIMVYTTRRARVSPSFFLRARIARVVPIYWLLTLAVFFLAWVAPSVLQSTSTDPIQLIKSLLFVPFRKSNGLIHPTLFVGWTLNYEAFFYALFAVGLAFRTYKAGLTFTLLVLIILAAAGFTGPFQNVFATFYTSPMLIEFGFGIIVALVEAPAVRALSGRRAAPIAGAILLMSLVMLVAGSGPVEAPRSFTTHGLYVIILHGLPAAMAVMAAVVLEANGRRVAPRAIVSAGDASYALYLTHPFVTCAGEKALKFVPHTPLYGVLLLICDVAAVVIVAYGAHRFIEKPCTRIVRSWLLGKKKKTDSVSTIGLQSTNHVSV